MYLELENDNKKLLLRIEDFWRKKQCEISNERRVARICKRKALRK